VQRPPDVDVTSATAVTTMLAPDNSEEAIYDVIHSPAYIDMTRSSGSSHYRNNSRSSNTASFARG